MRRFGNIVNYAPVGLLLLLAAAPFLVSGGDVNARSDTPTSIQLLQADQSE